MKRSCLAGILILSFTGSASAQPSPQESLERAVEVLADQQDLKLKGIPAKLLADAQGVAIVPRVVKVGFVVAGRRGHGLVMTRTEKGEWSEPTFVTLTGGSVGFQAGVESTDVVLVFRKKDSLDRVLSGKGKLTLGADASIAAGPLGRQAAASTDEKLAAEIYSYSRSRGLFAGVSLNGAGLVNDRETNARYARDQKDDTKKAVADVKLKLHELAKEVSDLPVKP
jgi:lipid-binding SYLF domain-containing protein